MSHNSEQLERIHKLLIEIKAERQGTLYDAKEHELALTQSAVTKAETRTAVLAWMLGDAASSCGNFDKYSTCLSEKLEGTCEWILHRPEFCRWIQDDSAAIRSNNSNILWVNGHAGFGKTILCAHITDYMENTLQVPLAYFFVSSQAGGWDDAYLILRSWLAQLCHDDEQAFELVFDKWVSSKYATNSATRQEIVSILREVLRIKTRCTLVVDGLDECTFPVEGHKSAAAMLSDLRECITNKTRVVITSRDSPEIRGALAPDSGDKCVVELCITAEDVKTDNLALSKKIISNMRRYPQQSEAQKVYLSAQLADRCAGQMLWLRMQKDTLRNARSPKHIEEIIQKTPDKVFDVYEKTWAEIQEHPNCQTSLTILSWVAFARRSLTVGALVEATLINEESGGVDFDMMPPEIDEEYLGFTFHGLSQLLTIQGQPATNAAQRQVSLAHFTVKEFLIARQFLPMTHFRERNCLQANGSSQMLGLERAHSLALARQCLIYIGSPLAWQNAAERRDEESQNQLHLRDYASDEWYSHLGQGDVEDLDDRTLQLMVEFMTPTHPTWYQWRKRHDEKGTGPNSVLKMNQETLGPLHYSVQLGLISILRSQAAAKGFAFQQSLQGTSALHLASYIGSVSAVQVLLQEGTYPDLSSDYGTPLHLAVCQGHVDVVGMLLEAGASVDSLTPDRRPPICVALEKGHLDMAKILLRNGACTNGTALEGRGRTARKDARIWTQHQAVSTIYLQTIDSQLSLDGVRSEANDLLLLAVEMDYLTLLKLSLQMGANLSAVGRDGKTPIHYAAGLKDMRCLKVLSKSQHFLSCINTPDNNGDTPLHIAASVRGDLSVCLLLQMGAKSTLCNHQGRLPIHSAILGDPTRELSPVLCGLLEDPESSGFVNALDNNSNTPINLLGRKAIQSSTPQIIQFLLSRGADLSIPNNKGRTPIHHFAKRFALSDGLRTLLGHISSFGLVNAIDKRGDTPMHLPLTGKVSFATVEVTQLLLNHGADPSIANNEGNLPIHCLLGNDVFGEHSLAVLRMLLHRLKPITMINATGKHGCTALILLAQQATLPKTLEAVQLLLELGAEVGLPDENGAFPIHAASRTGSVEVLRILLSVAQGLDSVHYYAMDPFGWTPLHLSVVAGSLPKTNLLLESGARTCELNGDNETPFDIAWKTDQMEIFDLLYDFPSGGCTCPVEFEGDFGSTILWRSCREGKSEWVKHLTEGKYASLILRKPDNYGATPLDVAVRYNRLEAVKTLLKAGSTLKDTNNWAGASLVGWAKLYRGEHESTDDMIDLLRKHAKEVGADLLDDEPPEGYTWSADTEDYWCNACTLPLPKASFYYKCHVGCYDGSFALCPNCVKLGAHCPFKSHRLLMERVWVATSDYESSETDESI